MRSATRCFVLLITFAHTSAAALPCPPAELLAGANAVEPIADLPRAPVKPAAEHDHGHDHGAHAEASSTQAVPEAPPSASTSSALGPLCSCGCEQAPPSASSTSRVGAALWLALPTLAPASPVALRTLAPVPAYPSPCHAPEPVPI